MNAAVLEGPPCVCEVYADCVRLKRQRGVTDEVYIQRIDSSRSCSSGERPSLQLSPSPPAATAGGGDQRRCLGRVTCWGAFGVFLEPAGGYLLLVEEADRVAQLGTAQILGIKSFRAVDLRLPSQQQQHEQQHEQQRWASHTRQLRRPLRLRLGDAVAAEVSVTTLRPVSVLETLNANTTSSSNNNSSNSSSSRDENEDSPYLPWLFEALAIGGFFCSLTVDLTVSLQRALQQAAVSSPVPAAAAAQSRGEEENEDRFLWNRLLLLPLQEHAKTLGLRVIQGYNPPPPL
ncbi:hypothetical protein Emag_003306 [Eimeria magna]